MISFGFNFKEKNSADSHFLQSIKFGGRLSKKHSKYEQNVKFKQKKKKPQYGFGNIFYSNSFTGTMVVILQFMPPNRKGVFLTKSA